MTRSLTVALFLIASFVLAACGGTDNSYPDDFEDDMAYTDDPAHDESFKGPYDEASGAVGQPVAAPSADGQARRVTIVDRGLQMPRGSQLVPEGWMLTQNVATDPNTGQAARYVLDLRGPRGELIRALGIANYAQVLGTSLEQTWRQLAMQRLQGEFADVSFGQLRRSATLEQMRGYQRVAGMVAPGLQMEGLEAPLRARREGKPVEGVVYVIHFSSPQFPAGTVQASVVLSPAGLLAETLRLNVEIADSHEPNPAYEQRIRQISQRVRQRQNAEHQQRMATSQAQHQQRMAASQARFDAHQQMMQGRYDAADQQMQSWQAQQRSNDEMHRRTINGINETVDLYDAHSGQTYYGVESGYDAYWTDPSGTVVGTQGYDNPDPMRYDQATDFDDLYDQGRYGGSDGW